MANFVVVIVVAASLYWLSKRLSALDRNISAAKASGLPYRISPISGIPGYLWIATHDSFLGTLSKLPASQDWLWPKLVHVHRSWHYSQEMRDALGEVYLIVSPSQIFMSCSNAEAIIQLTGRKHDFVKPVEIYAIVDIFGASILTTEGADWKRHRKIVAPAFSEKSNSLVWRESLRQAQGMLKVWSTLHGNTADDMKVKDTAPSTALMALHVICAAGFGVRQLWDGEDEGQLGSKIVPGFNTAKLNGSHTLTFKGSLNTLLHGIIWLAIFPVWLLSKSPFAIHQQLLQAYHEVGGYLRELSEYKMKQIQNGEMTEKGVMDIMERLVKASKTIPGDSKSLYLTKQEVISDAWITLFAGHETSANILHFTLLFLAIDMPCQIRLQSDIDLIVGSRPSDDWNYETDLNSLWHSMVGASINETLRLMPPVIDIPKIVRGHEQRMTFEGRTVVVPPDTIIHISAVGVHRNPRYWPHGPSRLTGKGHDLDDWAPERWLSYSKKPSKSSSSLDKLANDDETLDDSQEENTTTFEKTANITDNSLFSPPKGSFIPFSEGAKACPGKRFAQVEITAAIAVIFKDYSMELDVSEWASDEQVEGMSTDKKRMTYGKAMVKARKLIAGSQSEIFLRMRGECPVRFVARGGERFKGCFKD